MRSSRIDSGANRWLSLRLRIAGPWRGGCRSTSPGCRRRPEDLEAFLRAASPKAYESLVDRLLASPPYGERWGRHWLDVARFGESHGFEYDRIRDNAWPYRDYVIRSLNDDKPYLDFVREQIAGDVLARRNARDRRGDRLPRRRAVGRGEQHPVERDR